MPAPDLNQLNTNLASAQDALRIARQNRRNFPARAAEWDARIQQLRARIQRIRQNIANTTANGGTNNTNTNNTNNNNNNTNTNTTNNNNNNTNDTSSGADVTVPPITQAELDSNPLYAGIFRPDNFTNPDIQNAIRDIAARYSDGAITNFNRAAARLRERTDIAGRSEMNRVQNSMLGRGVGFSGLNDAALRRTAQATQDTYGQNLVGLENQFETQRQSGLRGALDSLTTLQTGEQAARQLAANLFMNRNNLLSAQKIAKYSADAGFGATALQQLLGALGLNGGGASQNSGTSTSKNQSPSA